MSAPLDILRSATYTTGTAARRHLLHGTEHSISVLRPPRATGAEVIETKSWGLRTPGIDPLGYSNVRRVGVDLIGDPALRTAFEGYQDALDAVLRVQLHDRLTTSKLAPIPFASRASISGDLAPKLQAGYLEGPVHPNHPAARRLNDAIGAFSRALERHPATAFDPLG